MAEISVTGPGLGNSLQQILMADDIVPGSEPSYQLCKILYEFHPIAGKLVDKPIELAQSQDRKISVPDSPEERVKEAFEDEWKAIKADRRIKNTVRLARIYGIASIAVMVDGQDTSVPVNYQDLWKQKVSFNSFDPLNTAGSLVLNQNPNAMDFQHVTDIRVAGQYYHRSRTCVLMNEDPIYISFVSSAFGFVGRSVYQRVLFPLKSFINTMRADDMVATKAGVIVAKMEQAGSVVDSVVQRLFGYKRQVVKEAQTYNVIGIGVNEAIESLNLQNIDGALSMARRDILENIATGSNTPAKIITQETFAEGFGEGTEDAKAIAQWVDTFRNSMQPLYDFFDRIVQHRAWNPEFYATIQRDFPEYKNVSYDEAFYRWVNSFAAEWPSLLKEPDSELVKVDDVKLKAVIAAVEILLPILDPFNRALVVEWLCDSFNEMKLLFGNPLNLDIDALQEYQPEPEMIRPLEEPREPKPFAAQDSARPGFEAYKDAVQTLVHAADAMRERTRRAA